MRLGEAASAQRWVLHGRQGMAASQRPSWKHGVCCLKVVLLAEVLWKLR